ncbi:hypothetical protein EC973_003553 [Apophysomyces ossiformis]|uniref:TEL2-interacting protein 1 n=1 Tax=Apophysomyces ossiformis TaxID=679940 RepID=A0A8H7BLB6_9FUNG|nr:hypothetical protein EC973_003553 [Apophysomyces ossiformis]
MSTLESQRADLFRTVHTIGVSLNTECSPLTPQTSRAAARLLAEMLQTLNSIDDPETLLNPPLLDSIIYPLFRLFHNSRSKKDVMVDHVIEPWLKCILFLLSQTLWKLAMKPELLRQLIVLFATCIDLQITRKQASEEIMLLAVQCLAAVMPRPYLEGRNDMAPPDEQRIPSMLDNSFRLPLMQCIAVLFTTMRDAHDIQLRLDAARTLSQILLDNVRDVDWIAEVFPSVISALCRTIYQKQEKESHLIIVAALETLGDLIQFVMRDDVNEAFLNDVKSFKDLAKSFKDLSIEANRPESHQKPTAVTQERIIADKLRTPGWHAATKKQLRKSLDSITNVRSHSNWKVRSAFVLFAYKLLSTCSRSMDNCVSLLIEMIVLRMDDEYSPVAQDCRGYIDALTTTASFQDRIVPILKEGLYTWIQSLPRKIMTGNEQEKLDAIALVVGHILLLRQQAESVLDMAINSVSDGLLAAMDIDKDSLRILEEKEGKKYLEFAEDDTFLPKPIFPKIRFKHLVTDQAMEKTTRLLNLIGQFGNLRLWLSHFMNYLKEGEEQVRPQAAYVIHALLSGLALEDDWVKGDNELTETRINALGLEVLRDIEDILANRKVAEPTAVTTRNPQPLDVETAEVMSTCLMLQVIATAALLIERKYLDEELITLLYPLLAYLGSPNLVIQTYALTAMEVIAHEQGHKNAQELAIANVDYIINSVSQRIYFLTENPRAPMVLKALVHVAGSRAITYLDDSVEEIYEALDQYHMDRWFCSQLCDVLAEVIHTLEANVVLIENEKTSALTKSEKHQGVSEEIADFIKERKERRGETEEEEARMNIDGVGRYFLERQKRGDAKTPSLEDIVEDEIAREQNEEPKEKMKGEKVEPLTKQQQMTLAIMKKVIHFLMAPSSHLRSQILILLTSGSRVLAERLDHLNPFIHTLWPLLMNRLDDGEHFVAFSAAVLVQTLAEISGEFLSSRIQDIWTRFQKLLCHVNSGRPTYYSTFSYTFRLEKCILETLKHFSKTVPMSQQMAMEIINETECFLDAQMHPELQQACIDMLEALSTQYADNVWFCALSLLGDEAQLQPPVDTLSTFKIPDWMKMTKRDCRANARKLLIICT